MILQTKNRRATKVINMKKLKLTAAQMVGDARTRINEIETADLIAKLDDPNLVIIDIRDIRERQKTGFIPGSYHAPRGMIEFWVDPELSLIHI